MEKSGIGIALVQKITVLLTISSHMYLADSDEISYRDIGFSETKHLLKYVNTSIKCLIESNDTNYEDKNDLKTYEDAILKLELILNENEDYVEDKIIDEIYDKAIGLMDETDDIEKRSEDQKKFRLSEDCAEEIRKGNYKEAVTKLYLINDFNMVELIVDKVYNGNKDNFKSIRKFGDEIPSILLSFEVYKSLKNELVANKHLDKDVSLLLIESVKANIMDQFSAGESIKSQASDFLDQLKIQVKTWIVEKLGTAFQEEKVDEESFKTASKITYGIHDRKFFREISVDVVRQYYSKYEETFHERMLKTTTNRNMRSVPRLILYNALYEHIIETNGMTYSTIDRLLMLQNGMKTANEDETEEFKISTNELWKTMPDVKYAVVKKFKLAILKGFFNEEENDEFTYTMIEADNIIFEEVMKITIHEIYDKMNKIELLNTIRDNSDIRISLMGFGAVFECMKRKGDLTLKAKNIGALIKLRRFTYEQSLMESFKLVDSGLASYLHTVQIALQHLKPNVSTIYQTAVIEGNYTNDDFKLLCEQIFDGNDSWYYINTLVSTLFPTLNFDELLGFVLWLPRIELKILGLTALNKQISRNSKYLFVVTQNLKILSDSKEFESIIVGARQTYVYHYKSLPSSVRHAIFSKFVFIKNLSWGGEYLYIPDSNSSEKVFSHVTWKIGNNTQWVIEYTGDRDIYKIRNAQRNEYIFATEEDHDENSRRVSSSAENQSGREMWRLIPSDKSVYIKNVFYKEYLFAGPYILGQENRLIFTYKPKVEPSNAKWAIQDATTGY